MIIRLFLALILLLPFGLSATTFTEFYCDIAAGTNINSGSTTNAAATYTAVNGNWDGTSVYTPTDGSTPASTVSAGMWASIYIDGATNLVQSGSGGCIMLITNVAAGVNGAITFNRAAVSGTPPTSSATARSIKVGGAWSGPYGSVGFPFGFLATTATNAPNVYPRCNFKNTAQYNVTAAMSHSLAGPMRWQGMTTTPGDLGKATIDGGATGTSYNLITISGTSQDFVDFILSHNGNTSAGVGGLVISGSGSMVARVCVKNMVRAGITFTAFGTVYECEVYACNLNNAAATAAFVVGGDRSAAIRCISHDNVGANSIGFSVQGCSTSYGCIAYNNGSDGFNASSQAVASKLINCDAYSNGGSGINLATAAAASFVIENCNLVKNTAYGIASAAQPRVGSIYNCGFGSGTAANGTADIQTANTGGIDIQGSVTYAANLTPWVDPDNGNFSINLTASKSAGRGRFTQTTVNSPTNTVSFPDIGAAQSASTNAAAGGASACTFAQ